MIRINLLPSKEVEPRGPGDIIVGGLVLFALIVSILALHLYQAKSLRDVNKETRRVEKRIKDLEEVKKKECALAHRAKRNASGPFEMRRTTPATGK